MIGVRWKGEKRFRRRLERVPRRLPTVAERNLARAGEVAVRESQKQFEGSRTRAKYRIKGGRRVRRKSSAGFATAPRHKLSVFTGQYRKSIRYEVRSRGRRRWYAAIGPVNIRYAARHEFGTGGMPRRPVIGPGMQAALPEIRRIMGSTWRVVLRR